MLWSLGHVVDSIVIRSDSRDDERERERDDGRRIAGWL